MTGYGLLDEIDLGDIVGATRPRRADAARRAFAQGGLAHDAHEGAASAPREVARAAGSRPAAATPLPPPDHRPGAAPVRRRARATVLRTMRRELDDRGYTEVETPVLQAVAGGAMARPFTTHHNALDTELKLRISLELYLKRLLVGGLERIYEIGRNFRNEGIDREHNPEFTMLELYEAYGDYETMMRIAEDLIRACAIAVNGSLVGTFRGRELDLAPPFRRVTVLDAVSEAIGEEITLDRPDLLRPRGPIRRARSTPRGVRARSCWSCSRSSWSTRSSSRRSSATSRARSRRSRVPTETTPRSPSTST